MMIFDRTADDVEKAKKIISEKVQKFVELSEEEADVLERGTITINTLNRIENKQKELVVSLNEMEYYPPPIVTKTWTFEDVFDEDELKRIVDNNAKIRKSFYALNNSPKNAIARYNFEEINALEKILNDISDNVSFAITNYAECGATECGG